MPKIFETLNSLNLKVKYLNNYIFSFNISISYHILSFIHYLYIKILKMEDKIE